MASTFDVWFHTAAPSCPSVASRLDRTARHGFHTWSSCSYHHPQNVMHATLSSSARSSSSLWNMITSHATSISISKARGQCDNVHQALAGSGLCSVKVGCSYGSYIYTYVYIYMYTYNYISSDLSMYLYIYMYIDRYVCFSGMSHGLLPLGLMMGLLKLQDTDRELLI